MTDDTTKGAPGGGGPLRVHFDQNCMNARGRDPELMRVDALRGAGLLELVANPRNERELENAGPYSDLARERLAQLPKAQEYLRWDGRVSRWGDGVWGHPNMTDVNKLFALIFPGRTMDQDASAVHDCMHVANANDFGADILLTRDGDILRARDKLGLRVRILTPAELLAELEGGEHA
jgi:hypothetical protein